MAYSRWSGLLPEPSDAELDEYLDLYAKVVSPIEWVESYGEQVDAWCRDRGFVRAAHYIFWDSVSGDERQEQILSIYFSFEDRARLTFEQARLTLATGDWSRIPGYEASEEIQRANVRDCVQTWLEEVEDECRSSPPAPAEGPESQPG